MRVYGLRRAMLATAAAAACSWAAPASAQATDEASDGRQAAREIEEVLVTATRREESLQDIPVTVTAFSSEALESQRIVEIQRLANNTPGVGIDTFPRVAPHHDFIGLFDVVFVLDIDADTLSRRLAERRADEFGGAVAEQELIAHLHATKQDLPKIALNIDATQSLARVVDEILSKCGEADEALH